MAKRHLLMLGLLLSGSALFSACSDSTSTGTNGDAGAPGEAGAKGDAGATGEAGAKGDAGASSEGGASGAGTAAGAGGEGGEVPYQFPPSLNPQAVIVVGPAADSNTQLLVTGADYVAGKSEVVSLTLGTGVVGDSTTLPDGDAVVTSSAGLGFALERSNDKVHVLDAGKIATTFDLKDLGTNEPAGVSKAYVPLYNQSLIAVLDLTYGTIGHRIDLNEYNAPGDSDHSAEIAEGVYDPTRKVVYFLLQRIDLATFTVDQHLPCSNNPALIVGIDTQTDEVVDLNGDAEGKAIELKLVNPRSLSLNDDGTTLYLLGEGCYEGTKKQSRGVEKVDLGEGTTTIAYEADGTSYLAQLILVSGETALIESFDDGAPYGTHWTKFNLTNGTLGDELADVPDAVSFDGTDLLGVKIDGTVGSVVRYKLSTQTSTIVSATSWAGDYSYASSTALVP